nr:hypothetical protein [Tanacetum cinerariifolium]
IGKKSKKSATHASTFGSKGKQQLFYEDDEMEMDIGLSQDPEFVISSILDRESQTFRMNEECRYKRADTTDPIILDDIDESNEWMMGQMDDKQGADELVFEDDDLTWVHVGKKSKKSATHASTFGSKGKQQLFYEDDEMEMDIGLSQDPEVNEVLCFHDDLMES